MKITNINDFNTCFTSTLEHFNTLILDGQDERMKAMRRAIDRNTDIRISIGRTMSTIIDLIQNGDYDEHHIEVKSLYSLLINHGDIYSRYTASHDLEKIIFNKNSCFIKVITKTGKPSSTMNIRVDYLIGNSETFKDVPKLNKIKYDNITSDCVITLTD